MELSTSSQPTETAFKKGAKAVLGIAFWLIILRYSFEYNRWHYEIPIFGMLKVPSLLTYGFVLWWFVKGDFKLVLKNRSIQYMLYFAGLMGLSILWAKHLSAFWITFYFLINIVSMIFPLVFLANDWKKLTVFFKFWVLIHFFLSVAVIRNGGVGSGSFVSDENDVSLALCMGMPYAFYLLQSKAIGFKWKMVCYISLAVMFAAVVVSFSRGGFLGLLSVLMCVWYFSRNRVRNALIALTGGLVLGGIALSYLPEGYMEDMQTISDPENSTRVERFRSWEVAWLMYKANPVFGVGTQQYAWNVDDYQRKTSYWMGEGMTKSLQGREAHSLYFSLLPDMGTVGTTVYMLMIASMVKTLRSTRYRSIQLHQQTTSSDSASADLLEKINDCKLLATAMLVAMAGFFVSGAFISVLYYPHLWILVGFVAALGNVSESLVEKFDQLNGSDAANPDRLNPAYPETSTFR